MKIEISALTAGRYGGGLNGNLKHFDGFLTEELMKSGFHSSFEEISLTLAYPPLYVLPGVIGMEKTFMEYYQTLPFMRLERKYKRITVTIPAPAFSEHFDGRAFALERENKEKIITLNIEHQYKGILEEMLAKILISELVDLGKKIKDKLKNGEFFDFECYQKVLQKVNDEVNLELLEKVSTMFEKRLDQKILDKALLLREQRKQANLDKNKLIRDLRVYTKFLPKKVLSPFDYQYSEIFLNLLKKANFRCPEYDHIYIMVAPTKEDALKNGISYEKWQAYGIAVLDYEQSLVAG